MKTRNSLIVFIIVAVLVLLVGCIYIASLLLKKPQGPPLDLTRTTEIATPAFTQTVITPVPILTSTTQPIPASPGVCNQSGSMLILVTGYDQTIEKPFGADFIRYIKADFDQPSITIVAVPRDIWLKTSALQAQKIDQTTLGRLFFYSYVAASGQSTDKLLTATAALNQTLYAAFSVVPDYYVTANLYSFAQMVDAIGGVRVNIPQDLKGSTYTFKAGDQLLNGDRALLYVRALPTASEWERIERQNLVLRALRDEVFSPSILPKVPDLIKIYQENLVTDLSIAQFADLACLANQVSFRNITYTSISPDMVFAGPQGSMLPDIEKIKAFLLQLGIK